jgi:3-deoxy-D-manno-octulosonic-acid transferase
LRLEPPRAGLEWLSLIYFFYSLVLALAMLLSLPYWLYQILRHGKYRRGLFERLGRVPSRLREVGAGSLRRVIWVHAVSVGEVLAVSGLVESMCRSFPKHRVLVSTTTDTGQDLARKRFGEENVFYFPMDFAFAIRPYLRVLQPELVVLAETEFWPNFLRLAHAAKARIGVVNARISDRSRPNYVRFRWALRRMLVHVDLFGRRQRPVAVDRRRTRSRRGHGKSEVRCEFATCPGHCGETSPFAGGGGRRTGAGLRQHGGRRRASIAESL